MDKNCIIEFFDEWAEGWDAGMVRNEKVIGTILDNCQVREGADVLDVACGTGVLIPDYLDRNVYSVTAVDISGKMCAIAARKFENCDRVTVRCCDIFEFVPEHLFDCIVVYNALPHFESDDALVKHLSQMLKRGGHLTIAHGASRKAIIRHHGNVSEKVCRLLPEADQLADVFEKYLTVSVVISNDEMYQVAGIKE
ncbi:MAG: class I SAM-dependent methyltransferase [Erysipelotrichaceae bacterium]|nr:class I SAM-dependent methyltransferase [Erysipelotrichaceae bacterium]